MGKFIELIIINPVIASAIFLPLMVLYFVGIHLLKKKYIPQTNKVESVNTSIIIHPTAVTIAQSQETIEEYLNDYGLKTNEALAT